MKSTQPIINLCEVLLKFGDDAKCRSYLEALRWQDKVTCPNCLSDKISRILARNQFDCDSCRYQFSVTAGTIFHDSHLPLTKWFATVYLMCESKKGMSANQIKRMIGISYKTAWYLCHRIRAAMKAATPQVPLTGTVEMDETYVGGKQRGKGWAAGRDNKEIVIGIRQRGGELRFFHAEDAKSDTLRDYIRENISEDVDVLVTDEFQSYKYAVKDRPLERKHKTVNHSRGEYVRGDIYTNTIESAFSLLKRGIIGTWHKISAKHLEAYLDEMTFRFNNRKNSYLFRDTLLKMIEADNLEYKKLTAKKDDFVAA